MEAAHICDFVTSVSDRNIVLVDEDLKRIALKLNPSLRDLDSLGGMSGSAVYVANEEGDTVSLAGFLCEAGEGTHASMFIAPAWYIRADGVLDQASMPW